MSKKAFGDEERKKWELASKSTKERMKDDSNQNEWNEAKRSVCVCEREREIGRKKYENDNPLLFTKFASLSKSVPRLFFEKRFSLSSNF